MSFKTQFKLSVLASAIALSTVNAIAGISAVGTSINDINSAIISIDGLPTGDKSSLGIDANGVNVDVLKQDSQYNEDLAGTTLQYATVDELNAGNSVTQPYQDTYLVQEEMSETAQIYTPEKLQFDSKTQTTDYKVVEDKTANVNYDADGRFTGINNVNTVATNIVTEDGTGVPTWSVTQQDTIIVGRENSGDENALTIRKIDGNGTQETTVTSNSVTTSTLNANTLNITDFNVTNLNADSIQLDGVDLATTITDGDTATLNAANDYTDTTAATLRYEAATESLRLDQSIVDGDTATLNAANDYTDTTAATLRDEAATESLRLDQSIVDGDTATLNAANGYTDTTAATLRDEASAESTRVNAAIIDGDAATLASAYANTASTATALRGEAAAESARVNTAIVDGDAATLASAKTHSDAGDAATLATARTELAAGDAATLASANTYTNATVANANSSTLNSANSYTDVQVANVNSRVNQLNSKIDDVEKTAYRGVAIALAAQQQVPNIKPGQFAVFGGVGHYEGESAGALGVVGAINERTSMSAAIGVAGGSEVGGRVGVAYVFGGK